MEQRPHTRSPSSTSLRCRLQRGRVLRVVAPLLGQWYAGGCGCLLERLLDLAVGVAEGGGARHDGGHGLQQGLLGGVGQIDRGMRLAHLCVLRCCCRAVEQPAVTPRVLNLGSRLKEKPTKNRQLRHQWPEEALMHLHLNSALERRWNKLVSNDPS